MPHEARKLCEDVLLAIGDIENFCEGKEFADFEKDRQLQAAVERELEIIGEALCRLRKLSSDIFSQVPDGDKVIGLRNVLAHGYDVLDREILWDVVINKLPDLKQKVLQIQDAS